MHFITIALISFLLCNFAVSITIISSNSVFDDTVDFSESDMTSENFSEDESRNNLFETVYAKQSLGKSHRFYFTVGERQNGDEQLDHVFKQTGWKTKTNAHINLTYPGEGKTIKSLTFVMLTVYQESADNQIHVIDGGIKENKITIGISANDTRYVAYNVYFYGTV
ncbi:uncharacterized protein LOC129566025 [Sitodiplosis mosellana]|uniref:uncharacterized protein LOC129566025 n=1 Tax=Sitodiplosis mosellana TaxID=263140 RepID=UPI002444D6A0|nr:uncharacterized protein LOC129566025 [Sitodiplosis mosellana]